MYSAWKKCYADSTEDVRRIRRGHQKVPDLCAQVALGTAGPPPLGMPCHTGYPGCNDISALLKKQHEQYEATEKLRWFSYPFFFFFSKQTAFPDPRRRGCSQSGASHMQESMCFSLILPALPGSSEAGSSADRLLRGVTAYRRLKPLSDLTCLGGKSHLLLHLLCPIQALLWVYQDLEENYWH